MSLASALALTAQAVPETALFHGYEATENVAGFPNPGTWIIFGLILMPVYVMVISWFVGKPRSVKNGLMGVVYLVGITTAMWGGMFIGMEIIGILFY